MGIFGAAIKGFGKALKNAKRKKRRKSLGLPERTKLQQRSAAGFVKLKKKMNKGKPDLVKQSGPSKTQVVGFGAAAGAGAGALATIKKNKPVKKAMGGEAAESLRKGQIFKEKRDKRRKEVDEMLDRLYGPSIKPKKKPKNPNRIKPKTKPKRPQESIMAMKKRSGGIINKVIGKRTPMSGGRDRRDSARKTALGLGTTSKSSTAEKSFALKKGTRPGQKSSVQKDKTRAAQRAGRRQDKFIGTARKMSGGRGRSIAGGKLPKKR